MKKVIFTLLTTGLFYLGASAQYCGGSGPGVCQPSGTLTEPGLSPSSDSLPAVVNGAATSQTIQFKNFNTFFFSNQTVTVNTLRIDTISNIPSGLCWRTNKTDNTFGNQEDGCILVSGIPCSAPGQYKLRIIVTADIGFEVQTNADAAGLKYYVRCVNSGDNVPAVDTFQTAPFSNTGYSASSTGCINGINDITNSVNTLSVVPNPFSNKAVVSFYSTKNQVVTERITNILGSELYNNKFEAKAGANSSVIEKGNLPAGVYFYSITDGKNIVAMKRVVISE